MNYGWIPYEYFNQQLAVDVWRMRSAEFIDIKLFGE